MKLLANNHIALFSIIINVIMLIAYTQQIEILVTGLPYCYLDPQKSFKKEVPHSCSPSFKIKGVEDVQTYIPSN